MSLNVVIWILIGLLVAFGTYTYFACRSELARKRKEMAERLSEKDSVNE
jgi:type VI protein secretion system component VasF